MEEIHRKPLYLMVKTYGFRFSDVPQETNPSTDLPSEVPRMVDHQRRRIGSHWRFQEFLGKNAWSHRANPTVNIEMCKNRLETEWFRERVYNWWMFWWIFHIELLVYWRVNIKNSDLPAKPWDFNTPKLGSNHEKLGLKVSSNELGFFLLCVSYLRINPDHMFFLILNVSFHWDDEVRLFCWISIFSMFHWKILRLGFGPCFSSIHGIHGS